MTHAALLIVMLLLDFYFLQYRERWQREKDTFYRWLKYLEDDSSKNQSFPAFI